MGRLKTVYVARSGLGDNPEWESEPLDDEQTAFEALCAQMGWAECWVSQIATLPGETGGFFRCYPTEALMVAGTAVDVGPVVVQRNVPE